MSLRLWLPVLSLLLTTVPLVFAVINVSTESTEAFEANFAARVRDTSAAIDERLRGISGEVARALDRIAADPVVNRELLEPLARGGFYDGERGNHEQLMTLEARRLMAAGVLDTLRVVDLGRAAHIIAMGHRSGLEPRDAWLLDLLEARPDPGLFFRYERVEQPETGGMRAIWTVQAVRTVRRGDARVAFAGGRELDRRLANELRTLAGQGAHVAIEDAAGRRVAATFDAALPEPVPGGFEEAVRALSNPSSTSDDSETVGTLRIYLPRTELAFRNDALWRSALIASAVTGGAALLLALVLSWRLSRGLDAVAAAAGAVARGEGRRHVDVRGPKELQRLGEVFNRMVDDLHAGEERLKQSERLAAWRDLARRIAHEIKNPLSPIQLSIETLQRLWDRRHPEFERYFREASDTVLEEVARMERIVTEFSNFARMAAPSPRPTPLGALVEQVARLVEVGAGPVDVHVLAPADGGPIAEVDADQVRQVVMNLVKNASEAAARGVGSRPNHARGRVDVTVRFDGDAWVLLEVVDDGPGIAPDVLEKLFTPYFTTRAEGTGLGLAVVRRIVDEHGGLVEVASEPGSGAVFRVFWPVRWQGGANPGA
jgi:two-component system nitrogen regulation sensor histidine kinase NtrY